METELKTLKEISGKGCNGDLFEYDKRIKAEAVKWVKEDIREFNMLKDLTAAKLVKKWIDRLNLTEQDLQEEKAK